MRLRGFIALTLLATLGACRSARRELRVGSKAFTEAIILGEVGAALLRREGLPAAHRRALGGTRVLWNALLAGEIDAYPEYTGTVAAELLSGDGVSARDEDSLRSHLARHGVRMSRSFGFEDTYALGMRRATAESLHIARISDLRAHPELSLGLSHEFLQRADGWPGLRARYELAPRDVRGMQHEIAYSAVASGAIAATDVYTTDAEVIALDLRVLDDDRGYFPPYRAVWLYREDLVRRAPAAVTALSRLEGRVTANAMARLNARARVDRVPEAVIAESLVSELVGGSVHASAESRAARIWARTREHLGLVAVSLLAAVIAAIPLGVLAAKRRALGAALLGAVGLAQTVPSLALLVFMIPLLGIGAAPAMAALFLYSLLPVVRATAQGITGIAPPLRESAEVLGLSPWATLTRVELPLASPAIVSGVKTAAVINVGTATLGALVGAGGLGEPILTGIRLAHTPTILEGAVPAALMALAAQALFALAERWIVPRGLRSGERSKRT